MKLRLAAPRHVVDINGIRGLAYVARGRRRPRDRRAHARVGSRRVRAWCETRYPLLADTCKVIADPLVRNLATVGGNLAHGDPANDHPATMLALGAEVVATGPKGERDDPHRRLSSPGLFATALEPDEILTEIRVPLPPPRSGGAYLKIERKVGDFATAARRRADHARRRRQRATQVGHRPHQRRPDSDQGHAGRGRAARASGSTRPTIQQAAAAAPPRRQPMRRPARLGRVQARPGASADRTRASQRRIERARREEHDAWQQSDQRHRQRRGARGRGRAAPAAGPLPPREPAADRHAHRLRHDATAAPARSLLDGGRSSRARSSPSRPTDARS